MSALPNGFKAGGHPCVAVPPVNVDQHLGLMMLATSWTPQQGESVLQTCNLACRLLILSSLGRVHRDLLGSLPC